MVAENEDFLTLAPYAPRFPFETWILPKQHESAFENSSSHMFENLAKALKTLLTKADRVLDNPPYNLVIHTSPVQDPTNDHYHWHIEFMPKLTKTAGFEWGTGFYINPTPPEEAAKFLREASVEEAVRYGGYGGRSAGSTTRHCIISACSARSHLSLGPLHETLRATPSGWLPACPHWTSWDRPLNSGSSVT